MSDPFLLALDQGTTSSRALLFDRAGRVVGSARREFRQHYPRPGWVEHDPAEIFSSQLGCLEELLARTGVGAGRIAAVGIANQRETTLVWERATGRPVHPAIVWQDRRTAEECRRLEQNGAAGWVAARTGLRLDPYFSATKLRWILDHVPGARHAAESGKLAFGTVDTWLLWQLTGGKVHATDASNASRTLLMNLHRGEWDPELLALFSIPAAVLPEIRATGGSFGTVAPDLPGAGLAIAGVVGDQQAALFGQGCHAPGSAKVTYGTGCFLLQNTGAAAVSSQHRLLTTVAWRMQNATTFALEGSVFSAGAAVQWLRDELRLIASPGELDELALSVADTAGAFLVPAFAGLGAPHWDPDARGALLGLTRGTSRAHLCRAALEAIAFQTAEVLEAMEHDARLVSPELRVDGGAARSTPLLQIQADLIGRPVVRAATLEATALGAAWLAGCAAGVVTPAGLDPAGATAVRAHPQITPAAAARRRAEWLQAVTRTKGWTNASA